MEILNIYHLGKAIPEDGVYIGRANAKLGLPGSRWRNPFPLSDPKDLAERERVIHQYRHWLWQQIQQGAVTVEDLLTLEGKNLVCYCAPRACHGHVLRDAVQWARRQMELDQSSHVTTEAAPLTSALPSAPTLVVPSSSSSTPPSTNRRPRFS